MKKKVILAFYFFLVLAPQNAFPITVDVGPGINKRVKTFREIRLQHIVTQSLDFSCGPASLATLLSYYFRDKITEEQIIKALILTTDLEKIKAKKGFSLLDLKNFARLRGYQVTGYKMDLDFLANIGQPVLIPIVIKEYNHFVIFRGTRGDRVFLADPALGNITMRAERFLRIWHGGIGLLVTKGKGKFSNTPLNLTAEEKAIFADPSLVQRIFGMDIIGNIYKSGEY